MSSMLGHCWLDRRKGIRPVKTDFWFDDVTGALQVLACTMATSVMYGCSRVQNGLTFWYWLSQLPAVRFLTRTFSVFVL